MSQYIMRSALNNTVAGIYTKFANKLKNKIGGLFGTEYREAMPANKLYTYFDMCSRVTKEISFFIRY